MRHRLILAAALALLPAAGAWAAPAARSCHLPGSEDALRCTRVEVPLDYRNPAAGKLALHVAVAPAYREAAKPDPLFVLAGGPGEAGSDVLPLLNVAFKRVRATRDIVFIDQRGTGLSGKLDCPTPPGSDYMGDEQADAAVRACIAAVRQPLSAYTTEAAARDIEQVRKALGYGKVNLWGGSYGTRLAQAYARLYPASVRALALDGVAAPEQVIPAGGRDGQAALDKLFSQCERDAGCRKAYPNLRAEFDGLAARVAQGVKLSLPDPRTARQVELTITSARFLGTIHNMLYNPADARRLPFIVHTAAQGNWGPFVARQNAATDFSSEGHVSLLLHLAVVCAEDMPRMTPQLVASDAAMLTTPLAKRLPPLCQATRVPAVPFKEPAAIEAPALLLSGALDPVTPPHRAASAAKRMPKAQQVVVENAGHGVSQLGCAPRVLRAFLDNPANKVDARCLSELPAPTFQLGPAGPQP